MPSPRTTGIRQAIANVAKRERRQPFFSLQLLAEEMAQAEVEALKARLRGEGGQPPDGPTTVPNI